MHPRLDLNLLIALDALLTEGSVTGAAERLHLSPPAMSRTLGRLRKALGDPVLVRSGRAMVPTPRAEALRAEVHALVDRADALFRGPRPLDLAAVERTFTLQADDSTFAVIAAHLLHRVRAQAPGVTLRFLGEGPRSASPLRDGTADLEIGVIDDPSPDVHAEALTVEEGVVVVRAGHPLTHGEVTLARYAAAEHLTVSRRGILHGPIDTALAAHGLTRPVVVSVPTATVALVLIAGTDLVGRAALGLHAPLLDRFGLVTVDVPIDLPALTISQAWHARFHADPAHIWLRGLVREAFTHGAGSKP
ncbi:LysR family transcriptional regulator [Actinorhabdospora filicis]|uniref:LysR family transcriptional regulator n=1 Tax=Actinorhabdospora filicis TaxID=1785913 RepID=A0A9W6SNI8_9ACTN|nr:LysR family transcriptional regulator [Actinorhabdospora filicis]GLZ79022.1 LysR family transcriptional regulator [Actinorhabdospora filicis]